MEVRRRSSANEVVALGVFILGTVRVMDQLQDALDCIGGEPENGLQALWVV